MRLFVQFWPEGAGERTKIPGHNISRRFLGAKPSWSGILPTRPARLQAGHFQILSRQSNLSFNIRPSHLPNDIRELKHGRRQRQRQGQKTMIRLANAEK